MIPAAYKRYRQQINIALLKTTHETGPAWVPFEHIHGWDTNPGPAITRQAIWDLVTAGLVEQDPQRPGYYRARGHMPTKGPKEDTMPETPSTPCKRRHEEPAAAAALRAEHARKVALDKAIEHHGDDGCTAGQLVATAKVFEGYLTGQEETPSVSHGEAQELHRILGTILLQVTNRDSQSIEADEVERALEIAAVIVSDTEGAE